MDGTLRSQINGSDIDRGSARRNKKPPGHDAKRLLLRLPVSQFRRCHQQRACGAKVRPARQNPPGGTGGPIDTRDLKPGQ
jgi:hypothetical protein